MYETTDIRERLLERLEGRLARAKRVEETRHNAVALNSGSLTGVKNAEGAYIDGHYLASFLASTATVEQILREQLPDDSNRYLFSSVIDEAESRSFFTERASERFSEICDLRNAHVHYRGEKGRDDDSKSVLQRSVDADRHPKQIVKTDAELALKGLYDVLEIAEIDLPDEVLPDN